MAPLGRAVRDPVWRRGAIREPGLALDPEGCQNSDSGPGITRFPGRTGVLKPLTFVARAARRRSSIQARLSLAGPRSSRSPDRPGLQEGWLKLASPTRSRAGAAGASLAHLTVQARRPRSRWLEIRLRTGQALPDDREPELSKQADWGEEARPAHEDRLPGSVRIAPRGCRLVAAVRHALARSDPAGGSGTNLVRGVPVVPAIARVRGQLPRPSASFAMSSWEWPLTARGPRPSFG